MQIKFWLLRRNQLVIYSNLLTEFRFEEKECCSNCLLMSDNHFDHLVSPAKDNIVTQIPQLREIIPVKINTALTSRYLATGNTCIDLKYQYIRHKSTINFFLVTIYQAMKG